MIIRFPKTLFFVMAFFGAQLTHAGILIEPYLGYENGQNIAVGTSDFSAKTSGLGMGLRLGYTLPILFWAGIDYSLVSNGTARPDISGSSYNYSRNDMYLVAGFNFPILIRGWIGYGLSNSMVLKRTTGDQTLTGGTNIKVGVGLTMLPLVTVYLEGYSHKSGKIDAGSGTVDVSTVLSGGYQDGGYVLGVSLPLDL